MNTKRHKLQEKANELSNEAYKIRQQIERIDARAARRTHNKVIGNYYRGEYQIIHIEKFDYKDCRYKGTVICDFGEEGREIKFDTWIFDTDVTEGKQVPKKEWVKALRQIKAHIKRISKSTVGQ